MLPLCDCLFVFPEPARTLGSSAWDHGCEGMNFGQPGDRPHSDLQRRPQALAAALPCNHPRLATCWEGGLGRLTGSGHIPGHHPSLVALPLCNRNYPQEEQGALDIPKVLHNCLFQEGCGL